MNLLGISSLFLASDVAVIGLGIALGVVALAAVAVTVLFIMHKKNVKKAELELGEASERAKKIVADAQAESKALKKEAILEAKEQELKLRNDFERESKEKRAELAKQEQRLTQREDNLDKR